MKQLLALFALVIVLGVGSLIYRNALERPFAGTNRQYAQCPADAQLCPDGSAVGRVAPACAFAACPFPNLELAGPNIAFAVPAGFSATTINGTDQSLIAVYQRSPIAGEESRIEVRWYRVPEGSDPNTVVIQTASASGGAAASMLDFSPVLVEGQTYETLELAQAESANQRTAYYLIRERDVLRFDAITNRESATATSTTPVQSALLALLATLAQR